MGIVHFWRRSRIAAGCAAVAGIEDTTTIAVVPDAAVGDAGADVDTIEEEPDAAPIVVLADASLCGDAAAWVKAVRAEVVKTASGATCGSADRVLLRDDVYIGLDVNPQITTSYWEGKSVHGCVGAQFDGSLSGVVVRSKMDGVGCTHSCSGTGCNSYHYFGAWLRDAKGEMKLIGFGDTNRAAFVDTVVPLTDSGASVDSPFVVICRTSMNTTRDDVLVDYIGGCP